MGDINYIMEQLDNLKDNPIQYPDHVTTKKKKQSVRNHQEKN